LTGWHVRNGLEVRAGAYCGDPRDPRIVQLGVKIYF
jgi:hypothetical protein